MIAVTFDTLKFLEHLKAAGVPDEQAKAQTEALADVLASGAQELATKTDLRDMDTKLAAEMKMLRAELRDQETRLTGEMKLIKWMVSATFGGVLFILLRLFLSVPH